MNDTDTARAQDSLVGLAFPVIRVRYAGPTDHRGSRYIATLRGVRHTEHYDCAADGSRNAYNAAAAVWTKYRAQHAEAYAGDEQPRVFVPGDLDADSYSYTVVPVGFLANVTDAARIRERLEYLRGEIEAERISYGEIAELQGLAEHIEPGDTLLREWAGVPEHVPPVSGVDLGAVERLEAFAREARESGEAS